MESLAAIRRPPFLVILVLVLLVSVVADSVSDDWGGLVLSIVSLYLQIAITLAAGASDPSPSGDLWIKASFRRRCFFRYLLTVLATLFLVGAPGLLLLSFLGDTDSGLVASGIGGFVGAGMLGGMFALAQPACAIERLWPGAAIRRSLVLSDPARVPIALVFFSLILVPGGLLQLGYALGWRADWGPAWLVVVAVSNMASVWGTIALTRIYVGLGGKTTPPLEPIAPVPARG
jgi:hypothetical protein